MYYLAFPSEITARGHPVWPAWSVLKIHADKLGLLKRGEQRKNQEICESVALSCLYWTLSFSLTFCCRAIFRHKKDRAISFKSEMICGPGVWKLLHDTAHFSSGQVFAFWCMLCGLPSVFSFLGLCITFPVTRTHKSKTIVCRAQCGGQWHNCKIWWWKENRDVGTQLSLLKC